MTSRVSYPTFRKFSTDELMEVADLFGISPEGLAAIRRVLEQEQTPPSARLFRYFNDQSKVARLEQEFASHVGSRYALGVNSGTSALVAALVAAGVGPGMEVIVPAYSFIASASSVVVAKAIPVVTEIDETLLLDPSAVERNLNERTKAIIVVHMNGYPARMDRLRAIADANGLVLIEDVAQAAGGKYRGKFLGTWGHIGCFSFDAYKGLATGEGGMITTDDEWLYTRAQSYHDTSGCWRPDRYARERRPGELFCGENYRMSEVAGAIGLVQLRRLDAENASTRRVYQQLRREVRLPAGMRWIDALDMDGMCASRPAVLFDTRELAHKVLAAGIGFAGQASQTPSARDWNLYSYWEHILDLNMPTADACPFTCPLATSVPAYSPTMCPTTSDLVMRTGFMTIEPTMTVEWTGQFAQDLNERLQAIVG